MLPMAAPTVRLNRLRSVLSEPFGAARVTSTARKMREAGMLPAGRGGFGGAHSARLSPQHVALILLALASGADPAQCPAAAKRLAGFKLVAISGPRGRRLVTETAAALRSIDVLAGCISAAVERSIPVPASWTIGASECRMEALEVAIFSDGSPAGIVRETRLPGPLLGEIAGAFERPASAAVAARKPASAAA
jgi:hypothetical protein